MVVVEEEEEEDGSGIGIEGEGEGGIRGEVERSGGFMVVGGWGKLGMGTNGLICYIEK